MRLRLALAAALLVAAACGDTAGTTTTGAETPREDSSTTAAADSTLAPTTTTTIAGTPPETTPPTTVADTAADPGLADATTLAANLPDVAAITECAGLVPAGLGLLQAVLDGLGALTPEDVDEIGDENVPAFQLLEEYGQQLDDRASALACDEVELSAGLVAGFDQLVASGPFGQLILDGLLEDVPVAQPDPPDGVTYHEVDDPTHTEDRVAYPQNPPVGGPHHPEWQNCGFYSEPVGVENAVHSLEHGVVWITYDAGLPLAELEALQALALEPKVLVSPYEGLGDTPVVASAWGAQMRFESALDPDLALFVAALRDATAPEPGAGCTGGVGEPELGS